MTALIFELEGVLVDTLPMRTQALARAMAAEGIELTLEEAVELSRGRSVRRAIAAAAHAARVSFDLVAIDIAASEAERVFSSTAAAGGIVLMPGAMDFLVQAQANARCALAARATRAETETILRLGGLEDVFECVVTQDDVVEEKPAPAAYRAVLARLERKRALPPRGVVALEDGGPGARAARTAGVICIVAGPAPASEALEADGYLPTLEGATMQTIRAIAARAGANVQ